MMPTTSTYFANNGFRPAFGPKRSGLGSGTGYIVGDPEADPVGGVWKSETEATAIVHLCFGSNMTRLDAVYTTDGYFRFDDLDPGMEFAVIAVDPLKQYNARIVNRLYPKVD